MHTFYQMWGVTDIEKAKAIIESQRMESGITDPDNLEEKAISLVGKDVYEMLIKGYTEKQWGKPCNELPYCLDGDAAPVTIRADKPSDVYVVDGADLDEHYRQSQEAERMGRDYMAYRLEQVKSRIIARYQQKRGIGVADI